MRVCVLSLPAGDEQSVLYLSHQLKVQAMLGLVARGPASEHGVSPRNCEGITHAVSGGGGGDSWLRNNALCHV